MLNNEPPTLAPRGGSGVFGTIELTFLAGEVYMLL